MLGRRAHRRELAHLEQAPWAAPEEMDRIRLDLLRQTVRRSAVHSPFYREVLGGRTPDIQSFDDLSQIPVTSKVDMTSSDVDRCVPGSRLSPRTTWRTSGSSGQPFVFEIDLQFGARHDAQRAFVYRSAGLEPGARIVEVLGYGDHLMRPPQFSYPTFERTIVGYARDDLAEVVLAARPVLLYGNRSHLLSIADEVEAREADHDIRFVCSSSETLHPADRARLKTAFGAPVLEVYGSTEASNIAFRLPNEERWRILEPRIIVEVLGDDQRAVGPGEVGEIVVSTLTEPTSPMLRYATGDLARVSAGPATGVSGLRIESLEGRASDSLVGAGGERVGFWAIAHSIFWASDRIVAHVERWQVHQHADRSVTVSLELTSTGDPAAVTPAIVDHLSSGIGPTPVDVVVVPHLHDPADGKFRAVTSEATLGSC